MKLNLGCGKDYKQGYINVDVSPIVKPDLVLDVTKGLPYEDNHFTEVIVNNILTQICHPQDFLFVMNELWRVGGDIYIRVPNVEHTCAFQDPMDCRRFTDQTFTYMEYGHRRFEQYGKHYGFKPFVVKLLECREQMKFKLTPKK